MANILLFRNRLSKPETVDIADFQDLLNKTDMFFYGELLSDEKRCHMATSPWMNRIILDRQEGYFIIIPKNLQYKNDIELATNDMFVVVYGQDAKYGDISQDMAVEIQVLLSTMIRPEEKEKYKAKKEKEEYYSWMYQYYRQIYAPESDEHIELLRNALENDPEQCHEWVRVLDEMLKTARSDSKTEQEVYFKMFLVNTDLRASITGAVLYDKKHAARKGKTAVSEDEVLAAVEPFRLKGALKDPELKKMLVRALEPESIAFIRRHLF